MFEPLKALLEKHGDKLNHTLTELRDAVIGNTEAQLERTQSARKSAPVKKEGVAEIRNDSGYGWRVKWVAATQKTEFFIGTNSDDSFMLTLAKREGKEVGWYIPAGGIIFAVNVGGEGDGYANLEIDVLMTTPVRGFTGSSDEHIEVQRPEPVPSGSPLDTPVAP
jgi:putative component of toxin-antitoxin plasmid stabilization module